MNFQSDARAGGCNVYPTERESWPGSKILLKIHLHLSPAMSRYKYYHVVFFK